MEKYFSNPINNYNYHKPVGLRTEIYDRKNNIPQEKGFKKIGKEYENVMLFCFFKE